MTAHGKEAVLGRTLPVAVLKKKFFCKCTIIFKKNKDKTTLQVPGIQDVGYFISNYK